MTIQKITDTKFLYQGQIVDLAFLQAKAAELSTLIAENEQAIKEIKFIELIPQIEAVPEYVEAAELFNEKRREKQLVLEAELFNLHNEVNEIEGVL